MKPLLKIRLLAIGLMALFTIGTFAAGYAIFTTGFSLLLLFALVTNVGFVISGIGMLKLRRWSWWLAIVLSAVSITQFLWRLFTTLTPETATDQNEIASLLVAGFYLGIAFLLTSAPVRKTFREHVNAA